METQSQALTPVQQLCEAVAHLLGNGWAYGKHSNNPERYSSIVHSCGASISIFFDTYRKKAEARCDWPKKRGANYSSKSDFCGRNDALYLFDDSIGFSVDKAADKVARDIQNRLLSKGYLSFYSQAVTSVNLALELDNKAEALAERLSKVPNGGRLESLSSYADKGELKLKFDNWNLERRNANANYISIDGKVNYGGESVELKLSGLNETQATQILTLLNALENVN